MRPPDEGGAVAFEQALAMLLRDALNAGVVVFVEARDAGPGMAWLDDGAAVDARAAGLSGWLFRLGREDADGPALFVQSTRAGTGADPRVQMAALLCRSAWRLRSAEEADDAPFPAALGESIHALRNGLNAGAMNAAVLASQGERLPESLRPVVERLEQATQRSADALHRLVALVDAMR